MKRRNMESIGRDVFIARKLIKNDSQLRELPKRCARRKFTDQQTHFSTAFLVIFKVDIGAVRFKLLTRE